MFFQIIAVCDFLNYLKYVERGLVKSSGRYIYIVSKCGVQVICVEFRIEFFALNLQNVFIFFLSAVDVFAYI